MDRLQADSMLALRRPGLLAPRFLPLYWVLLSVLMAAVDFWLGPYVQFPITFVVPVGLAAWFSGRRWGIALGVLLPMARLYFVSIRPVPWEFEYSVANAGIRVVILVGLALLVERLARQERLLAERVETLEGLLPICSGCKKIRDDDQQWQPLEVYIGDRSRATFTHGFCPHCAARYFGGFASEG